MTSVIFVEQLLMIYKVQHRCYTFIKGRKMIMHLRIVEHRMEFGWLFIVIFLILLILGIIQLANLFSRSRSRETHGESPIHILKRRYAKGEITNEEFEKMKDELTKKIC